LKSPSVPRFINYYNFSSSNLCKRLSLYSPSAVQPATTSPAMTSPYYVNKKDKKEAGKEPSARDRIDSSFFRLLKLFPGAPGRRNDELQGNILLYRLIPQVQTQPRTVKPIHNTRNTQTAGIGTGLVKDRTIPSDIPNGEHRTKSKGKLPPEYRALSYTWGPGEAQEYINIIDGNDVFKIKLKPNLASALRQLREQYHIDIKEWEEKQKKPQPDLNIPVRRAATLVPHMMSENDYKPNLFLWIDAICIDQLDEDEKSSQIPRMSEIYMKASEVCVWLGEEDDTSAMAIDLVEKTLKFDQIDALMTQDHSDKWNAFATLLRRPWFSRRWIVQELTRANCARVYCGPKQVLWKDFADAVSLFLENQHLIKPLFKKSNDFGNDHEYIGDLEELSAIRLVQASDHLFHRNEDGVITERLLPLEGLMSELTSFEASEPKDIVYAILWMAKDATPVSNKSFSVGKLVKKIETYKSELNVGTPSPSRKSTGGLSIKEPQLGDTNAVAGGIDNVDNLPLGSKLTDEPLDKVNDDLKRKAVASLPFWRIFEQRRFPIDYGKPLLDICCQFLEFCISKSGRLDIMCRPWAPDQSVKQLNENGPMPSWIRQLSVHGAFAKSPTGVLERINADPLVGRPGTKERRHYDADYRLKPWQVFQIELRTPRVLLVNGFVLGTVQTTEHPARGGLIPNEWLTRAGWTDKTEDPPERFWQTLVGNRTKIGEKAPELWRRACKEMFAYATDGGDLDLKRLLASEKMRSIRPFLERVKAMTFKRSLLTIHRSDSDEEDASGPLNGHTTYSTVESRAMVSVGVHTASTLALGPHNAESGDVVAIIYGCSVPLLLRMFKHEKEPSGSILTPDQFYRTCEQVKWPKQRITERDEIFYQLVGECYVHGMMDGEAVKTGNWGQTEEFQLI
jgi:hypothetical protein